MRLLRRTRDTPFDITHNGLEVSVTRKANKNFYLRFDRKTGKIRLSAPYEASDARIRSVIDLHRGWIERRLAGFANCPAPQDRQIADGATITVFGAPVVIQFSGEGQRRRVSLSGTTLFLGGAQDGDDGARLVECWLRGEMKDRIRKIVTDYEPLMGVQVAEIGIRRMKTRWGSCNIAARRIWLNLELGWLDPSYLEYVVVHEMVHLLERGHNRRFYGFMDRFQPAWKERRRELQAIGIQPR